MELFGSKILYLSTGFSLFSWILHIFEMFFFFFFTKLYYNYGHLPEKPIFFFSSFISNNISNNKIYDLFYSILFIRCFYITSN
jgi:hypothetical protein